MKQLRRQIRNKRKNKRTIPKFKKDLVRKADGTWEGHKERFDNIKRNLERLRDAWKANNCGPLPIGVEPWLETEYPPYEL